VAYRSFSGPAAVVTGAANGLGVVAARRLAGEGGVLGLLRGVEVYGAERADTYPQPTTDQTSGRQERWR
jgi:NAD(P)-dependent dehydrogenase (short-subunit alcohol dehydrogenase family)